MYSVIFFFSKIVMNDFCYTRTTFFLPYSATRSDRTMLFGAIIGRDRRSAGPPNATRPETRVLFSAWISRKLFYKLNSNSMSVFARTPTTDYTITKDPEVKQKKKKNRDPDTDKFLFNGQKKHGGGGGNYMCARRRVARVRVSLTW